MAELPPYATCPCGEYHEAALRMTPDGVRCVNCRDTRHRRGLCVVCERGGPIERHHPAGRAQIREITVPVCLNCHYVLSQRQKHLPNSAPLLSLSLGLVDGLALRTEQRPDLPHGTAALVIGILVICLVLLEWYGDRLARRSS